MALKHYNCVAKGLKRKVRKFWRLIPTFLEVAVDKLAQKAPAILNRAKAYIT